MTEIIPRALSPEELTTFARCEGVIERGLATFVDVGTALLEIRDGRLYRREFGTFEDYCRERWGFSRQRAHQLTSAAETVTTIVDTGLPAPANEGQARELGKIPEGERAEVWRETIERTGGKPTAAATRTTARMRQTAALLIARAYSPARVAHYLGEVTPARPDETTPELLEAAVAYLNARGITYPGVAAAAQAIRAELPVPAPAGEEPAVESDAEPAEARPEPPAPVQPPLPPAPVTEPGIWYGGPPEPPPQSPPLPDRQDEADAVVHRIERAAAAEPPELTPGIVEHIAADPAWQDKAYITAFSKALTRGHDVMTFDPARLGRIGSESLAEELDSYLAGVEKFIAAFRAARCGLRVIEGGQ
ncbi:hypothetical protein [Actinomadura formosensis]|uniref:hypothetical protein n=1 Tax=Actinomadura formosensis TaxID=60706 RepID=UPI003D93CE62